MSNFTLHILGNEVRGDFVLMTLMIIWIPVMLILKAIARWITQPRNPAQAFAELLKHDDVRDLLKEQKTSAKELAELIQPLYQKEMTRDSMIGHIAKKIARDIQWDMAGLIGLLVTVLLMIMVVSGTIAKLPDQIFTGWLMILSYYFGKSKTTAQDLSSNKDSTDT